MGQNGGTAARSSRCIALVGPYLSGKTTLLEAILARTGAVTRQGKIADKNTVGDASPEARDHGMSVELNVADVDFLGDSFTFIDCPGSIEFQHEGALALTACDAAVVVCEPDPKRVPALQLILKQLEDRGIPRFLFLNKIDSFDAQVRDILPMLQPASAKPLVLRQIPIWENGVASGFVDLALERAFVYRPQANAEVIEMPAAVKDRETEARFKMLEQLADYDDELMEQLLARRAAAARQGVRRSRQGDAATGLIVPVLLGSAENGNGILRLLKALRHEAPFVDTHGQAPEAGERQVRGARAQDHVHAARRQAVARARAGRRVRRRHGRAGRHAPRSAPPRPFPCSGQDAKKRGAGEGRRDGRARPAGEGPLRRDAVDGEGRLHPDSRARAARSRSIGVAIGVKDRKDEVKLTGALARLMEEDPSLACEHAKDTHQMVLWGQGEMHLRVALERLKRKYGVDASSTSRASFPTRRPSRKGVEIARPAQEAIGRPRPVRRRGARHQAAAARIGLPVRRRRSPAAWCRSNSSPRSRSACATSCSRVRSAVSRWSTWRSR